MTSSLHALPGASDDPGTGTVVESLVDGLLADAGTLDAHREHRAAWYGDVVGPFRLAAARAEEVAAALMPRDHGLRMILAVEPGESPAPARGVLLGDDRAELVGVELPLPPADSPEAAARQALAGLDLSTTAWFVVPPDPSWLPALDVLAEDGAEGVALHLPGGTDPLSVATVLRHAVDRDLACVISAGDLPVTTGDGATAEFGLLNLLCAVRSALNGADVPDVAAVLASTEVAPLAAAARRMSDADAAVVRAFLPSVTCPSVRIVVEELHALGLIEPDAA